MQLIIITHGAVEGPGNMCTGQSDVALSSGGFTAMQSLATTWEGPPPRFLFSSDLRRAQQSAQVLAARFATEPLLDPRLRELDMGDWQGRRWADIVRDDREQHDRWQANPLLECAPGGESFGDLLHRCRIWLSALLDSTMPDDTVVSVGHGSTLRALLCHALELPPANSGAIAARPATVSQINYGNGLFEVCYVNAKAFQYTQGGKP